MRLPERGDNRYASVTAGARGQRAASPAPVLGKSVRQNKGMLEGKRKSRDGGNRDPLDSVLDAALDAVVVMGTDDVITGWNSCAERIFGWTREDAIGRRLPELLIPERLRADYRDALTHDLATGEGRLLGERIESTALRRSGEEFPVELSISMLRQNEQTVLLAFVRDITARKRSQSRLEMEAQRARVMHQLTSFAAQSASVEDSLRHCLKAICEMTGWAAGHAWLPTHVEPVELVSSVWHAPGEAFPALREQTGSTRLRPGVGLPGQVWTRKQPLWIEDVQKADSFPRATSSGPLEIRSAFAFPIVSCDDVTAVLEFFDSAVRKQDENVVLTARALGDQVGRVLERKYDRERQHALLAELNHRVKNMLAVVVGIATQTARSAPNLAAFSESFTGRLMSLSRTYSLMTSAEWQKTQLKDLIREVLSPHADITSGTLTVNGPEVMLRPKMTLAMSMILHELLTNAVKHGALSVPGGHIDIEWRHATGSDPMLQVVWQETGGPAASRPQKPGFGLRLIETSVRHELRGSLESSYGPEGVRHEFRIPWQGN